eukprot:67726-Chlamydomonas_euryale.AAC.2
MPHAPMRMDRHAECHAGAASQLMCSCGCHAACPLRCVTTNMHPAAYAMPYAVPYTVPYAVPYAVRKQYAHRSVFHVCATQCVFH